MEPKSSIQAELDSVSGQAPGGDPTHDRAPELDRRRFLQVMGGGAIAATANPFGVAPFGVAAQPGPDSTNAPAPEGVPQGAGDSRRDLAYRIRHDAALYRYRLAEVDHPTNGDEERYPAYRVSFGKTLPHNALGEVDAAAFRALLAEVRSGAPRPAAIPRGGTVGPEGLMGAFGYVLEGSDPSDLTMPPPPRFDSEEMAAEMVEDYWQALTRDVPYAHYGEEPLTRAAIADLRRFARFADLTPETLFRGPGAGEADGPYISQFLLQDIPFGAQRVYQPLRVPMPGSDYLTDWDSWLRVQNGQGAAGRAAGSGSLRFDATPRYLRNGRDLAEWVRIDFSCQCGWHAALILDGLAAARKPGLPPVSPLDLLGRAPGPAGRASGYQKWAIHRSLRPEEMAARVHNHLTGAAAYPIHPKLLESQALTEVFNRYGTYLLPMAYPNGSPAHPSYPAMHAVVAGAGITVLKALYDEDAVIRDPVVPSDDGLELLPYEGEPLTVGGELNKLGGNVAFGRDVAGVHFRADGIHGLKLGEDAAIAVLRDLTATFGGSFGGFTFTSFDGSVVHV
jgi:hypothetical protein